MQFFDLEVPNVMGLPGLANDFRALASRVHANLPRNPERTAALRKLLEARDCAVRAALSR